MILEEMMKCVQPVVVDELEELTFVGEIIAGRFRDRGLPTFLSVVMAGVDAIKAVPGVKDHRAGLIWAAAAELAFDIDARGLVDDLCEVGSPFTEAESADLARAGVHTFKVMSELTVEQLVEITGVGEVDAAAAINCAKVLAAKAEVEKVEDALTRLSTVKMAVHEAMDPQALDQSGMDNLTGDQKAFVDRAWSDDDPTLMEARKVAENGGSFV